MYNILVLLQKTDEIIVKNISVEHGLLGTKLKFEYEYAGMKCNKTKLFQTVWFPDKKSSHMKLLIDPNKPSAKT